MSSRDEFTASVKHELMRRAGYACSFDNCTRMGFGPSSEASNGSTNTGKAAHICAAAPGRGARRYDRYMSKQQRSSIDNAIWLCSEHASLIDQDEVTYTVNVLQAMKFRHEKFVQENGPKGLYLSTKRPEVDDIKASLSWFEYLQNEARTSQDNSVLDSFIALERKAYQHSGMKFDIAANASLLLAFEISKATPDKLVSMQPLLSHTRRLAQKRCREAMAAKWVLARIDLSLASGHKSFRRKHQLTLNAYNLLSGIETTIFHLPVLLPGVSQEIKSSMLDHSGDPNLAPFVSSITKPHRYCTAAALSLSGLSDFQESQYLQIAEHHSERNLRRGDTLSSAGLNARISIVVIQSIRHHNRSKRIQPILPFFRNIDSILENIEEAEIKLLISDIKAKEFRAVIFCCALVITEDRSFLDLMTEELELIIKLLRRVPDFLTIDHIYRIAFNQVTDELFSVFVSSLATSILD